MSTEIFASVVLIILVCVATSYFILNHRRRRSFIKVIDTLPGPRSFPLIGNTYIFGRNFNDALYYISHTIIDTYPSPFRFWVGSHAFIVIYDADQIKTVLKSQCFDKFILYNTTEALFGKGLVTSRTSAWRIHRKIAGPVFNANSLRSFYDKFVKHSLIIMDELEKLNGNEIMFYKFMCKHTFDIADDTLMDVKLKSQTTDEALEVIASYLDKWQYIAFSTMWNLNAALNFTKIGSILRRLTSFRNSLVNEIIEKNKCMLNNLDTSESNKKRNKSFFGYFWEAYRGEKITQEEFYDNIFTMLIVARDTTSITMYFVIFVLANFPEIQEKVYEELSGIYGTKSPKSAPIKYEDLQRMDYLNRVIKETMRLFPPAPVIGRLLTENLKIGNFTLPKGANVVISIFNVHRNKKYWPNPLMFDPERFLPEKKVDSSNYYIPFSDGLRNCIGAKYAMMSMKVILATLIRTFEFKIDKKIKIDELKLKQAKCEQYIVLYPDGKILHIDREDRIISSVGQPWCKVNHDSFF